VDRSHTCRQNSAQRAASGTSARAWAAVKAHHDEDVSVAARANKLVRALDGIGDDERWSYYHRFGM
jgi:hypothetical protein